MNCKEAENAILLDESGEMNPRRKQALEIHLAECKTCRGLQSTAAEVVKHFAPRAEPSSKAMTAVLREARLRAPDAKPFFLFTPKPALAAAACIAMLAGLLFFSLDRKPTETELIVSEVQLLEPTEQMASIMYSGLSEDDLAFNFLMTYDDG